MRSSAGIFPARDKVRDARKELNRVTGLIERLPDNTSADRVAELNRQLDRADRDLQVARKTFERVSAIAEGRSKSPSLVGDQRISVGREETTYRRDSSTSFFSDLYRSQKLGDAGAQLRLQRHAEEVRDITGPGGAVGLIPPIYLAEEWAKLARPGRKFADRVPKMDMPSQGETVTIPKVNTGVSVDVQTSENSAVSETDITSGSVTAPLVTIAGQQDVSRQALERGYPGLDMILFDDLMRGYDQKFDDQLLNGSGSSGQHRGIRNVSGPVTVSYTDASPTGAELLPVIYGAISQVASQRFMQPDLIVMHPRRAAWLAATLSSTFPLFQQGGLFQASGQQDEGFVGSIAGLPVLTDPNVRTNLGAGTNEDEIYVLYTPDLRVAEDDLRQTTFEEVLSGSLTVRLQVFAFSFFVPDRYPKSTAIISGTGLAAPAGF